MIYLIGKVADRSDEPYGEYIPGDDNDADANEKAHCQDKPQPWQPFFAVAIIGSSYSHKLGAFYVVANCCNIFFAFFKQVDFLFYGQIVNNTGYCYRLYVIIQVLENNVIGRIIDNDRFFLESAGCTR